MTKEDIKKIKNFWKLTDELGATGRDIDELLESRDRIEIEDIAEFIDMAKRYDSSIYVCSDTYLNFVYDDVTFFTSAECGVQEYLATNNINFKIV